MFSRLFYRPPLCLMCTSSGYLVYNLFFCLWGVVNGL